MNAVTLKGTRRVPKRVERVLQRSIILSIRMDGLAVSYMSYQRYPLASLHRSILSTGHSAMSSPPSSPRHAVHRPEAVKRTYGSRTKQNARARIPSSSSNTSDVFGRASSPPELVSCSSDGVNGMSSSGFRIQTPEVEEEEQRVEDKRKGRGRQVLVTNIRDNQASEEDFAMDSRTVSTKTKPSTAAPARQSSLKSFFTFHSQAKVKQSDTTSSTIRVESINSTSTKAPTKGPKLAQLHLVPVCHSSSSSTLTTRPTLLTTCPKCNMSYIRGGIGGTDDSVHRAHCIRVTEGVKWDGSRMAEGAGSVTMTGAKLASWRRKVAKSGGGVVVRRDVDFGEGKGKGKAMGNVVCAEGYEAASDKRVRSSAA